MVFITFKETHHRSYILYIISAQLIFYCFFYKGPPASVIDLQGYQLDYCCVFISWDPPYTLPGLTVQYIISVGTEQYELISTNYTYCPLNLTNKEYQFNITASNKVGNGSTSNITVGFQSSMYTTHAALIHIYTTLIDPHFMVVYQKNVTYHIKNNWSLHFLLSVSIISLYSHTTYCIFVYRLISSVVKLHLLLLQ